MSTLYRPELLYYNDTFHANLGLLVDDSGRIKSIGPSHTLRGDKLVDFPGKALLPGFVNAHSHSFQRLIRGKAESRATSGRDFWSWRGTMYHAAGRLSPEDLYDVARMAFLEMVLAGTTTVGEFHYLHNAPDGQPYDDPNLLSKQVIEAANSVGLRMVLLRTAYLRSGYQLARDPGQHRFFETRAAYLENIRALCDELTPDLSRVTVGVAPHSIRAVPLDDLYAITAFARDRGLPIHMHVAEQVAENEACLREFGATPVALLAREKLLGSDFTAVHAIHITADEVAALAAAGATICSCPTTERNLGDGILAADQVLRAGIAVAFGSDSQAQIDPLEDARELDYHLRLQQQQRAILDQIHEAPIAQRLFACATTSGAHALAVPCGRFVPGAYADFFTLDLRDPSIAGNSAGSLLPLLVFGMDRSAICDVVVGGEVILRDGRHPRAEEIVSRYAEVQAKVWRDAPGAMR